MSQSLETFTQLVYAGDNPEAICDSMIVAAIEMGASDIHIEPLDANVRVRFRVDGVLREILEYQSFLHPQIVARFKILGKLKMDETRKPQDGRISHQVADKAFDLRLSTLPTVHGEKIVMRIVDKSKKIPPLEVLGIEWKNGEILERAIRQPNGIILNSGPTGSGKSTTLYSIMLKINDPKINIMTFEDPVENVIDGLNQSQVFPDIGYSFATGLRTALRQDPDVMMVGEIRDRETVDIAIEASLTGHLVLSTIHTNSAAETLTRILNMGVKPFLLPATINAIIAQRLIRKINKEKCKKVPFTSLDVNIQERIKSVLAVTNKDEITSRVDADVLANPFFYEPDSSLVQHIDDAYDGRTGIYEILEIWSEIKELLLQGSSATEINRVAVENGMISLEQDGIIKALQWITSLQEVYRVVKDM